MKCAKAEALCRFSLTPILLEESASKQERCGQVIV